MYAAMSTTDREPASLRSEFFATRPISRDNLVPEDAPVGLIAFSSPNDPEPRCASRTAASSSSTAQPEADFDLIDEFIARHGIDLARVAEEAMAIETLAFARMLVDPAVPRDEIARLVRRHDAGQDRRHARAARAGRVLHARCRRCACAARPRSRRTSRTASTTRCCSQPTRPRRSPSASASSRRPCRCCATRRLNALALLVGGQVAAAGALTQCSVEERTELELGMRGLTTYAETVSVYGTEQVFVDGDDTPWSKAFLASCYASRGLKMRFTSGSGAECLMGATEGKSMLYLEARCIAVTRAAGAQGVQNGGIDGVYVTASVPDGMREVIAENLCVMLHDLESCTGNDTLMSASDIRRTAHTLPLLLAGSDFLFSGFGSIPAYDNAFGPSNFNAEDIDDYLVVQRDWGFEGGLRARDGRRAPAPAPARRRGVPRRASRSSTWRSSPTRTSRRACVAHGTLDVPELPGHTCPDCGRAVMRRGRHRARRRARARRARLRGRGRARARDAAPAPLRRLPADVRDLRRGHARPLEPDRPERLRGPRHRATACARTRRARSRACGRCGRRPTCGGAGARPPAAWSFASSAGPARRHVRPDEVVVGLSPAFGDELWISLSGLTVAEVLRQVLAGHRGGGRRGRLVRVRRSIDVGNIGWTAARLSGSGVSASGSRPRAPR